MTVVSGGGSLTLWIYSLLFTSVQLWGTVSTSSTNPPALPAPFLEVSSRSRDSAVLVCRAPAGHRGIVFTLYQVTKQVDSMEDQHGSEEARFTVRLEEGNSVQQHLYCCLYKNHHGFYSPFSPYLKLDHQQSSSPPTRSAPSFPPPVLSMKPSTGLVKRGQMLSFHCSLPAPQPQSRSQLQRSPKPASFLLLKTAGVTGVTSMVLHPQATLASNSTAQLGDFVVGPVRGGEGGSYTCLYQVTRKRELFNSTVSNMIQVTIADLLPVPTLALQQQEGVWHLFCTGSPSYPGAVFSLYQVDNKVPVANHRTLMTHHHAVFPVPVQDAPSAQYQCQYSALLGREWGNSERSLPLAVSKGISPTPSPGLPGVDWPLLLGSFSAVVLFIGALVLVAVVAHKKGRKHSSGLKFMLKTMLLTLHSDASASTLRKGPMRAQLQRQPPDPLYGTLSPHLQARPISNVCLLVCLFVFLSFCLSMTCSDYTVLLTPPY